MAFRKIYLLLVVAALCLPDNRALAQQRSFGHFFVFDVMTTIQQSMTREPVYITISDTAVYRIFDEFSNSPSGTTPKSPIILGVKLNPVLRSYYSAVVQSISKEYYTFVISDSSDATLIAMGINPGNYRDFRYHVVENDSTELVPWSPVTKLEQGYGAKQPYALLGHFNAPGKRIMVEVVNARNYSIREGVIFDWRTDFKPILNQITVEMPGSYFNLASTALNHGYATRFNRITGVPEDFRFCGDSVRNISFDFKKQETLARSVHLIRQLAGVRDTLWLGFIDQYGSFVLLSKYFQQPGWYELVFQRQQRIPNWQEAQLLRIPFEVLSAPSRSGIPLQQVLLVAGAVLLVVLLVFLIVQRYNRQRIQTVARQKEAAQLRLKSVRSQLNPHFMFNALGSIQNLMNRQETGEANHYLTRFATLTRSVLDSSEQEMISLKEELTIADNYLQMEQLRFGFSYQLAVDPTLQPANIDLPPMLLQPFIENAVKHGIAGSRNGLITIQAKAAGNHLRLIITDDGTGFDTGSKSGGFGLKLSRERIELLNQLYPGQPFELDIHSTRQGTTITITLNKWL